MDVRNYVADRLGGMYEILENSNLYCEYIGVNEGLIAKIKQIRADKKARKAAEAERKRLEEEEKAEQRRIANAAKKEKANANAMLKYVIYENETEGQNDFENLIEEVKSIIRKEIPGARFENRKPHHNKTQLGDGHVLHKYTVSVFTMSDKNLKGFISNTRNTKLKMLNGAKQTMDIGKKINTVGKIVTGQLYNSNDMALGYASSVTDDEIKKLVDEEIKDRIFGPIADIGFKYKRNILVNYRNGLEYMFVKTDSMYFGYEIQVGIRYITKNY